MSGVLLVTCLASAQLIGRGIPQSFQDALEKVCGPVGLNLHNRNIRAMPDSYRAESGDDLEATIIVFKEPIGFQSLAKVKRALLFVESDNCIAGRRRFNVNPGLLDSRFLYMASHKDGARRAQIAADVWIEPQLRMTRSMLRLLPWSFEEFADAEVRQFIFTAFEGLRQEVSAADVRCKDDTGKPVRL